MNSRKNRIHYFLTYALICSFSSSGYIINGMDKVEKRNSSTQTERSPMNDSYSDYEDIAKIINNDLIGKKGKKFERNSENKIEDKVSPLALLNISGSQATGYQANLTASPEEKILIKLLSIMSHRIYQACPGEHTNKNRKNARFASRFTGKYKRATATARASAIRAAVADLLECKYFDLWYMAFGGQFAEGFCNDNKSKLNKSEKTIYNFLNYCDRNIGISKETDAPKRVELLSPLSNEQLKDCFETQEKINAAMNRILEVLAPKKADNKSSYEPKGLFGDDWVKYMTVDGRIYFECFSNPNLSAPQIELDEK